jgi:nitrite transporter NirC
MTAFSIALLGDHPDPISLYRMGYNLWWVTLGNVIGGALFMGMSYWAATPDKAPLKRLG